jgi:hypothetical protein
MRITICLIFAVVFFSCCKSKQNGVSTPPAKPAPSAPLPTSDEVEAQKQAYNNVVISFYSIGEGVNAKAIEAIENFIGEYSKKINKAIPYSKIAWGREGEVDYCILLTELKPDERKIFVDESRRLARQFELTHFFENHPCRELK